MRRFLLVAGLMNLTALVAWGAEDDHTRSKRFQQLHAERRQQWQDYCAELKLNMIHCMAKLDKEGHCQGAGMPETQWLSEICQWQGTCCVPPSRIEESSGGPLPSRDVPDLSRPAAVSPDEPRFI
jgi:hypothetical protein